MCTVSWLYDEGGYQLFFNRDELRTRQPAFAPHIEVVRRVPCIAPRDGNFGGTWLGVNAHGVSVGLVNYYPARRTSLTGSPISRGLLVFDLLDCSSPELVHERLTTEGLQDRYRPFILLVLAPTPPILILRWDGRRLVREPMAGALPVITSSSVETRTVEAGRREWFATVCAAPGSRDLEQRLGFHRSHHPERGPYSVCMHREDAHTVSFSHITCQPEQVTFRYHPAAPCHPALPVEVSLPRTARWTPRPPEYA